MKKTILNVDLDSWWALLDLIKKYPDKKKDIVINKSLPRLRKILKLRNIKITFFAIGADVENSPGLYKDLIKDGHEIGNHTYSHNHFLKNESYPYIKEEIKKTHDIIQDKLGITPIGFRAPNYSVNETVIHILKNLGYLYDTSVIPSYHPGITPSKFLLAPTTPYNPSEENILKKGKTKFIEFPLSINPLLRIPLMGTYTRIFGLWWLKFGVALNKSYINFNFHARDVVDELPKDKELPFYVYWKVNKCISDTTKMIDYLIKKSKCMSFEQYLKNYL